MKYVETLKITFEKQLDKNKTNFKTAYLSGFQRGLVGLLLQLMDTISTLPNTNH